MAKNSSIDLLAAIAEERDLNVDKIKFKKVPAKVKATLTKWMRESKVPLAALKKKILHASYANDKQTFYVFAFEMTKPRAHKGKVIVQGTSIIGESSVRSAAATPKKSSRPKAKAKPVDASKSTSAAAASPQQAAV